MCLAVPARIEAINGEKAVVSLAGLRCNVIISLTPQAKVGQYVLVHAGYAIAVVSEADAHETFAILHEMRQPGAR